MLRKLLCAGFVAAVVVSLAVADEFGASIRKVDNGKVTFVKFKKGTGDKKFEVDGEPQTLPVADNVKVQGSKFNKDEKKLETTDLEGGLKNERFKNIGEKGVVARITTDDGKITEIRLFPAFGGKKDKK